ncbi:MAG: AAA family ATPase [Pseudomonadales bacterium]|nr:AAA family ATPase [Pseudomonadales bacterium]
MNLINLEFPVLIEQSGNGFTISPLLMSGPRVSNSRYGDAVRALQQSVRKRFLHAEPDTELCESLLWYRFCPEVNFELLSISLKSGMSHIEGLFAVAFYELNGHRYACLPRLNDLTVRISQTVKTRQQLMDFLIDKIAAFFRALRKEQEQVEVARFVSKASDSITTIKANTEIVSQQFPFELKLPSYFAFLSENQSFNGASELNKVGEDLTLKYPDAIDTALFREAETELLARCLFEAQPQAIVIVGKSGIGKTNLIHNVLKDYMDQHRQRSLTKLQKLWRVDPLRVISGMSVVGQWERRFEAILGRLRDRLVKTTGKIRWSDILYIDNPIALLRIGKTSQTSLTLSHLLKPYLERREIPVVLEATAEEWQKLQEIDRGFADLFQVMRLEPLSKTQLNKIYVHKRAQMEYQYQVAIGSKAMLTVLKSEPRFRGNNELPGNVISILEKLCVRNQRSALDEAKIYQSLESQFHIKREMIDRNATLQRADILKFFADGLIGQPEACQVLTDTVLAIKAQLTPQSKPLNTLLFVGPTGVGKTEAVKLLANYLFDRSECLVRIDMNEYVDAGAVERLIGSQYYPKGILTEQVRYTGACVVLLDEVEKAHPRVHDLLLQLLDDGRLTDALGNTTDFTQSVIVMTSNIGAQEAGVDIGFAPQTYEKASTYLQALEQFFRPETINRINNIVVFNTLQRDNMQYLARLHLARLLQRDGFTRRKTILNVDETCLSKLADQSYDPRLGARALKRNLEKSITQLTAKRLAEIASNDPIILNVMLEDDKPATSITQLHYQQAIPTPFSLNQEGEALDLDGYKALLEQLEAANGVLTSLTGSDTEALQFASWSLSSAIREISEPLQQYIWETEDRLKTASVKGIRSFQLTRTSYSGRWKDLLVDTSALFAQNDMREYLLDLYKNSEEAFQGDLRGQWELLGETRQLVSASHSLVSRGIDQGTVIILPLMTEGGTQHLHHLSQYVRDLVESLGSVDALETKTDSSQFSVSGCGIQEMLTYESGVHLFIEPHSMQVPILMHYVPSLDPEVIQSQKAMLLEQAQLPVLRLYTLSELADADYQKAAYTITDLRLGLSIDAATTPTDLKILLYPAFAAGGDHHGDV